MQALWLLALEPVSETTADHNSYGFRPMRSTHDAIESIFLRMSISESIAQNGYWRAILKGVSITSAMTGCFPIFRWTGDCLKNG